jgi:hypothetical protein
MLLQIHQNILGVKKFIEQREIKDLDELKPWMDKVRSILPGADLWLVLESSPEFKMIKRKVK